MSEVGRPPVLRVGHQRIEVFLQGREVEFLELLSVVEVLAHGIGQGRVLLQNFEVQLVRPPVPVPPESRVGASTMHYRALAGVCDIISVHTSNPSLLPWLTWSVNADRNYSDVRFGFMVSTMTRCQALSGPGLRQPAVSPFGLSATGAPGLAVRRWVL